jgi:hypothetical protein
MWSTVCHDSNFSAIVVPGKIGNVSILEKGLDCSFLGAEKE